MPEKEKEKKKIWLDCDPGHDDAMAILLAGYNPSIDLIGVSTVHGNQSVEKTTRNALACLAYMDLLDDLPVVARGLGKPLARPAVHCAEIHGESGLDDLEGRPIFPLLDEAAVEEALESSKPCVSVMHDHIAADDGRVTLVATGALTNVALLLTVYPEMAKTIDIVFMGGAYGLGNTGPVAEFNMQIDPEAASIVFESGAPVTMVPLEVTHTALATDAVIGAIRQSGESAFRNKLADLLLFFADSYSTYFGFDRGPPLHDPCAVAYVIDPDLFKSETIRVDVETKSDLAAGQTICDRHNLQKKRKNATVCHEMEVAKFWDLILDVIRRVEGVASAKRKRDPTD